VFLFPFLLFPLLLFLLILLFLFLPFSMFCFFLFALAGQPGQGTGPTSGLLKNAPGLEFQGGEGFVAELFAVARRRPNLGFGLANQFRLAVLRHDAIGLGVYFVLTRVFSAFGAGQRAKHDVDTLANELWIGVGMPERCEALDEFVDLLKTKLFVGHFSSAETESHLDLHVLAKKINCVLQFDPEIVGINVGAKLDFLDLVGVLMFARLFFLLGQFVAVLPEINQTAYRRGGVWGDFNQINPFNAGHANCFGKRKNADIFFDLYR